MRRVLRVILLLYAALYLARFIKLNYGGVIEIVRVSDLPEEVRPCVELYDETPESVEVYVEHVDIDGDGVEELIVDAGPNVRGAANWWYTIWKRQADGMYRDIGIFCSDWHFFMPRWAIIGYPGILCDHGKLEWVPWENGCYSCVGPI